MSNQLETRDVAEVMFEIISVGCVLEWVIYFHFAMRVVKNNFKMRSKYGELHRQPSISNCRINFYYVAGVRWEKVLEW